MNEVFLNGNYKDDNGNIIVAPENLENVKVRFYGKNNFVFICEEARKIKNLTIDFTLNNGRVLLGDNSIFGAIQVSESSTVIIGDEVTTTSPIYITSAEGRKIVIGDDCMFATHNQIRSDDAHAIYDITKKSRHNPSKDITIGAHVWVACNAVIFGGTSIGHGSIVGYNSFVKNVFPNNSLIVGSPAKLSKKSMGWTRKNLLWQDKVPDYYQVEDRLFFDKTNQDNKIYLGDGCSYLLSLIHDIELLSNDTSYFKLDKISLLDNLLSLKGNALLKGVECYNYGAKYQYSLLLKKGDDDKPLEISLGKANDKYISKSIFDGRNISYKKSKFVMKGNMPLDISNIDGGEYKLFIKMNVNGKEFLFNLLDYLDKNNLEVNSSQASLIEKDDFLVLVI